MTMDCTQIRIRTGWLTAAMAAVWSCALLIQTDSPAASLTLVWDAGASGAVGYTVYSGEATRNYSNRNDVGTATTIKVDGLVEGMKYYFAVTAYDPARLESNYSNEISATIPYAPPVVAFSASPASATAPATVTFNNTTTGQVTQWAWNFGDGSTSSEQSPTHAYSAAGNYYVTLTATGPGGTAAKTLETPIQITAPSTTTKKSRGAKRK
jgi:PKD repeat protein